MKIKIEIFKSSYRLRFTYPKNNRNTITVAPATRAGLVKAQQVAQLIELDILNNSYDYSHNKYSFTLSLEQHYDIKSLWQQYKKVKSDVTSLTTQLEPWRQTDSCLDKLSDELLQLNKSSEAIAFLLKYYSVGTLERVLANLKAACNLAVEKQQIERNLYLFVKLPKRQKPQIKCFSDREVKIIINAFAKYRNGKYLDYVSFLAYTLCRPEEALAISATDINLANKTIIFNKAYSRGILKTTKNNSVRVFPINNQLLPLAIKLVAEPQQPFVRVVVNHRSWARDVWKPIVSKSASDREINEYLKCYCLRHSGITRLVRAGYDIATVAKLAGTSPEMIMRNYLASHDTSNLKLPEL